MQWRRGIEERESKIEGWWSRERATINLRSSIFDFWTFDLDRRCLDHAATDDMTATGAAGFSGFDARAFTRAGHRADALANAGVHVRCGAIAASLSAAASTAATTAASLLGGEALDQLIKHVTNADIHR